MIVDNIRTMCRERGITVSELELECDLSRGTILNWSKRGGPGSFRSVCRIADYFGVSLDQLAGREPGGNHGAA